MKFPVNYFGSITTWIKANYTHWGENWFLQVGDSMQGDAHRFYISQDAPLNVQLALTHVDGYSDIGVYFDGDIFYYYESGVKTKMAAEGVDEIGHYLQFNSGRYCTAVYVKGALLRNPNWFSKMGPYYVKPISVGDKLGLVYWDGTTFSADSTYAVFVKNNPDWDCVYLYKGWGGLGVRKISTDTNKILIPNGSTGTVNLSGYGFTITGIANGTGTNPLGKHLMHVI